eukprot:m.13171 g.13171  ORF g.13171 m.13171 type:complete len:741 (+) comp4800_c0_seq1:190-2412(+)
MSFNVATNHLVYDLATSETDVDALGSYTNLDNSEENYTYGEVEDGEDMYEVCNEAENVPMANRKQPRQQQRNSQGTYINTAEDDDQMYEIPDEGQKMPMTNRTKPQQQNSPDYYEQPIPTSNPRQSHHKPHQQQKLEKQKSPSKVFAIVAVLGLVVAVAAIALNFLSTETSSSCDDCVSLADYNTLLERMKLLETKLDESLQESNDPLSETTTKLPQLSKDGVTSTPPASTSNPGSAFVKEITTTTTITTTTLTSITRTSLTTVTQLSTQSQLSPFELNITSQIARLNNMISMINSTVTETDMMLLANDERNEKTLSNMESSIMNLTTSLFAVNDSLSSLSPVVLLSNDTSFDPTYIEMLINDTTSALTVQGKMIDTALCTYLEKTLLPIQSIGTVGIIRWLHFEMEGEHYIMAVNKLDNGEGSRVNSVIYKWASYQFVLFQRIPTLGAGGATFFTMENKHFLVVANSRNGNDFAADSIVYQFVNDNFEIYQRIPTLAANQVEHFTIDGSQFLAVALGLDKHGNADCDSVIYRWNGTYFEDYQHVRANSTTDVEFFTIGETNYLVFASFTAGNLIFEVDSIVFAWNGSYFEEFERIGTSGARSVDYFNIDGKHFLAFANKFRNGQAGNSIPSTIFQFNGDGFELFQEIATFQGSHLKHFEVNGNNYLAIANFKNGGTWGINSFIYQWNGTEFIWNRNIRGDGAVAWEHFTINNVNFLLLANHYLHAYEIKSPLYMWLDCP